MNSEAGNLLQLANTLEEEADKFVLKNNGTEINISDHENYPPKARYYFLQLKWFWMWGAVTDDLRLSSWINRGGFSDLEEQTKIDLLEAIEVTKEAVDEALDTIMDIVGYTGYRVYDLCTSSGPEGCGDWQEILALAQDFVEKVNEAIGE